MLETGRIIRNQVAYDSFEPADWGVLNDDSSDTSETVSNKDDKNTQSTVSSPETGRISDRSPPQRERNDYKGRQTGDIDCYKIYLRSMGKITLVTVIGLAVSHVVLSKMICS